MSIKLRNIGEFTFNVSVLGTVATGLKSGLLIPFSCQLKAIYAKSRVAGTTGTQTVDVLKNGTTIFSGAVLINEATTATANTYGPLTVNPTTFVKGDQVTINVATVNTTPATDWVCILTFQRQKGTGLVATMLGDTVGPEAEL